MRSQKVQREQRVYSGNWIAIRAAVNLWAMQSDSKAIKYIKIAVIMIIAFVGISYAITEVPPLLHTGIKFVGVVLPISIQQKKPQFNGAFLLLKRKVF